MVYTQIDKTAKVLKNFIKPVRHRTGFLFNIDKRRIKYIILKICCGTGKSNLQHEYNNQATIQKWLFYFV